MKALREQLDWIKCVLTEYSLYLPDYVLMSVQHHKLKKLLKYAVSSTDYYKEKLAHISYAYKDFESLPVLTRQDLKNNDGRMVNHHLPPWMYGSSKGGTSGSTGEPVRFYCSTYNTEFLDIQLRYMYQKLFRPIVYKKHSVHSLMKKMRIVELRAPVDLEEKRAHQEVDVRHLFLNGDLLKSQQKQVVEKVFDFKPYIFGCYAYTTLEFCTLVEKFGYVGKLKIPYVINSGEALLDGQITYIEKILGGKVYNRYGTSEFGSIATELEGMDGYISCAESFIIEIVNDENKSVAVGETGRVLVTDLTNYTQPFIRYELGDLATLLEKKGSFVRFTFKGRNRFVTLGTKRLSHFELNALFAEHAEAILQYQIVKKGEHEINVRIVKNNLYFDFMTEDIKQRVEAVLGFGVKVQITFPESIPTIGRNKTPVYIEELF